MSQAPGACFLKLFCEILSLLLLSNVSMRVRLYLCASTTALVIHVGVRLALIWLDHVTELSQLFL